MPCLALVLAQAGLSGLRGVLQLAQGRLRFLDFSMQTLVFLEQTYSKVEPLVAVSRDCDFDIKLDIERGSQFLLTHHIYSLNPASFVAVAFIAPKKSDV